MLRIRGLWGARSSTDTQSYNAVTVAITLKCCEAARATQVKPILVRTLPRLPLPGCSMPAECRCQFREWPDRRIGERRLPPVPDESAAERRERHERRRQ